MKCANLGVDNIELSYFENILILEKDILDAIKIICILDVSRQKNKKYYQEKKKGESLISSIKKIIEDNQANFDKTYMAHKNCDLNITCSTVGLETTIFGSLFNNVRYQNVYKYFWKITPKQDSFGK